MSLNIQSIISNFSTYLSYINISNYSLVYLGLCMAIGFSIGFIAKHYFKLLFYSLIITILAFYGAQYLKLVDVNYSMLNSYIELGQSLYPQIISFIVTNIAYAIAVTVGLVFSWIFS